MRLGTFALAAATLLSASLVAQADTVNPGSYSGTQLVTTGTHKDGNTGITYTDSVYADTSDNPFCSGCLDFVIQISDPSSTYVGVDAVNTTGFSGYSLAYAYDDDGDTAPTSVSANKSGNKVTFDFDPPLYGGDSDSLIIYTNATDYTSGGLTIGTEGTDPPAYAPNGAPYNPPAVTPEPSSLILLGTGLLGIAGVMRRRFV